MRRRQRYPVETIPAPITVKELEIEEVVVVGASPDTITLRFLFTNKIKLKQEFYLYSWEYKNFYAELKQGDKVKVRFRAGNAIDIVAFK